MGVCASVSVSVGCGGGWHESTSSSSSYLEVEQALALTSRTLNGGPRAREHPENQRYDARLSHALHELKVERPVKERRFPRQLHAHLERPQPRTDEYRLSKSTVTNTPTLVAQITLEPLERVFKVLF